MALRLGQAVTGMDVVLARSAVLSGRVLSSRDGTPLRGVCFEAGDASARHLVGTGGCSAADGRFRVTGLPTEAYSLQRWDGSGRWVSGTEATATVFGRPLGRRRAWGDGRVRPGG